jgi:hypothetical protein
MTAYDEILLPRLFNPFADALLDEVGVAAGLELLDVPAAPGRCPVASRRGSARRDA